MAADDIAQAVLAREDVSRFIEGSHGLTSDTAREKVLEYLEELKTTQRYELYRALEYPLYPILRKIERIIENPDIARKTVASGRVVYVSNHRSHTDYLVELLVVDDLKFKPPIIAAGVNLFGGPLGLIHKHVTGALPIRRNTKDPAYLITLRAYVSELLHRNDLFFYPEGGRSYSGELKPMKAGLLNACIDSGVEGLKVLPCAIAYDLVLEDHILSRQQVKKRQKKFSVEIAEMVRYAVGYRSRAFVTFGQPIPLDGYESENKRSVVELTRQVRAEIGRVYKVLPTALVANAMTRSLSRHDLLSRLDATLDQLRAVNANLSVATADEVLAMATEPLEARGIIAVDKGRYRVRERNVLRYYARSIAHLLTPSGPTH